MQCSRTNSKGSLGPGTMFKSTSCLALVRSPLGGRISVMPFLFALLLRPPSTIDSIAHTFRTVLARLTFDVALSADGPSKHCSNVGGCPFRAERPAHADYFNGHHCSTTSTLANSTTPRLPSTMQLTFSWSSTWRLFLISFSTFGAGLCARDNSECGELHARRSHIADVQQSASGITHHLEWIFRQRCCFWALVDVCVHQLLNPPRSHGTTDELGYGLPSSAMTIHPSRTVTDVAWFSVIVKNSFPLVPRTDCSELVLRLVFSKSSLPHGIFLCRCWT